MDDKIKTKSLDNSEDLDFYEKIVQKDQLFEQYDDLLNNTLQETGPADLSSDDLRECFAETVHHILRFKTQFKKYICDDSDCEIELQCPDAVIIYCDVVSKETAEKISNISSDWIIKAADCTVTKYNLMIKIKVGEMIL